MYPQSANMVVYKFLQSLRIRSQLIKTFVAIYLEAARRKIFKDFRIILTLFLLTLNKSVSIKL